MRNYSLSIEDLDIQISNRIFELLKTDKSSVLQKPCLCKSDSSSLLPEVQVKFSKKFRFLRALCILVWYIPEESVRWEIFLALEGMKHFSLDFENKGKEYSVQISLLLKDKETMLQFLHWTEDFSASEFFGTILEDDLEGALSNLKIKIKFHRKPKEVIWRRGYKDKGSRRPEHLWLPSFDFLFDKEFEEIEQKRQLIDSTVSLIHNKLKEIYSKKE